MIRMFTIAVGVGCLLLGAVSGVMVMSLCFAAKNADIAAEEAFRNRNYHEQRNV
ncbi:hypothetical protein ACWOAH_00195 [Vagococcus vulneris]|uniref:hypothetical protein n=2 Tax=Enterococcaceae TaxID=81852 RepID=UPI0002826594|nr:hypothetical protein [Vagococcus vulneris]EJX53365.1 hypothetical protein HMPREF1379_01529 [Enterococcus faecium R497]